MFLNNLIEVLVLPQSKAMMQSANRSTAISDIFVDLYKP